MDTMATEPAQDSDSYTEPGAKARRMTDAARIARRIELGTYVPAPYKAPPGVQAWNDENLEKVRRGTFGPACTVASSKTVNARRHATARTSHASGPGHRRSASTSTTSSQDPGDGGGEAEPAGLSASRRQFLQRRATVIGFRAVVAGGMTEKIFSEGTTGMSAAEKRAVAAWLSPEARAQLAADRAAVAK